MASAVLERRAVALPDFDREERTIRFALDRESRRVLGSTVLTPEEQRFFFLLALSDLGIEPYTRESVRAYQKEMATKMNREIDEKFANREHRRRWRIVPALWIAAILWFLVGIFLFPPKTWGDIRQAIYVVMPAFAFAAFGICASMSSVAPKRWIWQGVATHNYRGIVPAFAAQSALAIEKRVPWAEFSVEELSRESISRDPFLVVRAGGEKYYVAVWDEPTFPRHAS